LKPPGSILVVDRGYLDFTRLYALHRQKVGFVIRAKDNLRCRRIESRPVDATTGLRADQTILLQTPKSKAGYGRCGCLGPTPGGLRGRSFGLSLVEDRRDFF
jgi:hypothetical protein